MEGLRPGFNCQHGQMYEIKLIMLFVIRASKLFREQKIQSYECATKADGYGIFDDLVATIHYNDSEGKTRKQTFCVQAKHSINAEKVVTASDLKDKKSKWSLVKLYESSGKVKTIPHEDCAFILYTNNKFHDGIITSDNIGFETRLAEKLAFQLLNTSEIRNENIRIINSSNKELSKIYREKKIPENFMKDVAIFDDQKSESELDSIIKSIILQLYPDSITEENIQEIYNGMFEQFSTKWMSGRGVTSECNEVEKIRSGVLISIEQKYFRQKFQESNLEFNGSSNIISENIGNQPGTYTKINSSCIDLSAKKIETYFRENNKKTVVMRKKLFLLLAPSFSKDNSNDVFIIISYSCDGNIDSEAKTLLEKYPDSKIIIITKFNDNVESISDKFALNELKENSQKFLLEKKLLFQGYTVQLESVINNDDQLDSLTLKKLSENDLEIGDKLEPCDVDDYYIPRTIHEPRISMKILEDPEFKDMIFVSGVSEDEIVELIGKNKRHSSCNNIDLNSNIIIHQTSCQNHCEEFKLFCKSLENLNVHILSKVGNSLRWEKSRGDVKIISKYLENVQNIVPEEDFVNNRKDKGLTLISNEAGMGKSCLLTNIANKIKNEHPECLVLKINLNSVSPSINKLKANPPSSSIEIINELTNSSNIIISNMVSNKQKNVFVLLDGYDEISTANSSVVTEIIKILISDGICVFLTSRPNMLQNLEEQFSSIPFSITPFTREDQIEFLIKCWQKNEKNEKLQSFACNLLENFYKFDHLATEMTGIPLITRFLATIYEDKIIEFDNEELVDSSSGEKLHMIYKEFIMNMINHYFEKLNVASNPLFASDLRARSLYSKLTSLAVCTTLKNLETEVGNALVCEHESVVNDEAFVVECRRIGLITITSTNQVLFLHQTIADFLVAEYLRNNMKHENPNEVTFFTTILVNPQFKTVRLFLDDMLSSTDMKNEFPNVDKFCQNILSRTENVIEISVCEGNVNILRFLFNCLKHLKDEITKRVFSLNKDGYNCLHLVCKTQTRNNNEIASIICNLPNLEMSINLLSESKSFKSFDENCSALHFAALNEFMEIIKILILNKADINIRSSNGNSAIMFASKRGNINVIRLLLNHGADVNARNNDGDTALLLAARRGRDDVVTTLLQQGADVSIRNNDGNTALLLAARRGRNDVVTALLGHGADINARNNDGDTALLLAARRGRDDVVTTLLQQGADISIRNNDGDTALLLAARRGRNDVVTALLGHGADINARNNDGDTALILVTVNELANIKINDDDDDDDVDIKFDNLKKRKLFFKSSKSKKSSSDTIKKNLIRILLARGADVNISNNHGDTALHKASVDGNTNVIFMLLQAGADVNIRNNENKTPPKVARNESFDVSSTLCEVFSSL